MAKYFLTHNGAQFCRPPVKGVVVQADTATKAKELCASMFDDPTWTDADASADFSATSFGDGLFGWTYQVRVERLDGDDQAGPLVDVSVTGHAGWGLDEIGAALKTALNALPEIATADWTLGDPDTANNILKIADADDGLGDRAVNILVYAPGAANPMASMVGTITDSGVAAADLTALLTYPSVYPNFGFFI